MVAIVYVNGNDALSWLHVAKEMDVEVDTDKYYFERILTAY